MISISAAFDDIQLFDARLSNGAMYMLVAHRDPDTQQLSSYKVSIDTVASALNSSLNFIRSASRCMSSDFATLSHDHDIYTSAIYENAVDDSAIDVFTMTNDSGTPYTMSISSVTSDVCDAYEEISECLPKLGTMQFMSIRDMALCADRFDYTKPDFTGWAAADGNEYSLTNFLMSSDIPYAFQSTSSKFTLPVLNTFIKLNMPADAGGNTSYDVNSGLAALPQHSHTIEISPNSIQMNLNSTSITADDTKLNNILKGFLYREYTIPRAYLDVSKNSISVSMEKLSKIHNGINDEQNYQLFTEWSQDMGSQYIENMASIAEDGSETAKPNPSYNLMPAVVYVGPSRYSDLQRYVNSVV